MTRVLLHTLGSVLIATLFHGAINLSQGLFLGGLERNLPILAAQHRLRRRSHYRRCNAWLACSARAHRAWSETGPIADYFLINLPEPLTVWDSGGLPL